MSPWRPALRMARRDLRRHPWRALLTSLLVALPVVAATIAALTSYNSRWDTERQAWDMLRDADAMIRVSRFEAVRPRPALYGNPVAATGAEGQTRDPREVDLAALLPEGTTLAPEVTGRQVSLAGGGRASASFVDLDEPLHRAYAEIASGQAPRGTDEVAVTPPVAEALGLLDADGALAADATLDLADGSSLSVVGLVGDGRYADARFGAFLLASPESRLAPPPNARRPLGFLADLPPLDRPALRALVADLNAAGIAVQPRDSIVHPRAWGVDDYSGGIDLAHVATGALVVLIGLLEVVLVVGAAFAVAGRRQVRQLGLLAANGGDGASVRRVLLAQGLVLGLVASTAGALLGVWAFHAGLPWWGRVANTDLWRAETDWTAVSVVAVLGSMTAVVAAILPAWSLGRLTPVSALSGRFPIRPGEARAHRGAFVLVGAGLLVMAVGGLLTARSFAPRGQESGVPPFVSGLGLLAAVAGVIWATPFLVRAAAHSGVRLPLAGRFAFRDAGRHRFRSTAAVMALTITVAAGVLTAFGFASVAATDEQHRSLPPQSMMLELDASGPVGDDGVATARATAAVRTVEERVGPVDTVTAGSARLAGERNAWVTLRGWENVRVVSAEDLARLLGPGHGDAVQALEDGRLVVRQRPRGAQVDQPVDLVVHPRRLAPAEPLSLPWTRLAPSADDAGSGGGGMGSAFVSPETAADLGLVSAQPSVLVLAQRPFTQDDVDGLSALGIYGWTEDPGRSQAQQGEYAAAAVAGLLTALVVGIAVALAAAEGRDDAATLSAVGAGPMRRRSIGAMHGLFLAGVGAALGIALAIPAGIAFTQVDGLPGFGVPWLPTASLLAFVLLCGLAAGWAMTPTRLGLTRRTA